MGDHPSTTGPHALPVTGITVIDDQHGEILAAIATLEEAHRAGHGSSVLEELYIFLSDYTATHFAFEEFAMQGAGYPGLEAHRASHLAFTRTFEDFRRRYLAAERTDEEIDQLCKRTAEWLRGWLAAHVTGEDLAMAEYLRHPHA